MNRMQPDGQNTRRYRYRATSSVTRPVVRRQEASQRNEREQDQAYRGRRVTMPREVVQPPSWAERHERFHQPQAHQPLRRRMVQRTLAQTGRPAPVGQMRVNKPLPRSRAGSPVPVRSGRQRGIGRFWRRLFGFLVLLAVVVGGISFALTSSAFHIQQVDISGTQNPGLIEAIRHMGIQGQNIFLLNSSALVARMEALPLVAAASLGISLPNRVTVAIQERVPVLLWQSGKNTYGVAQDGTVIAPLSELGSGERLALVVDKRHKVQVRPGTRLSAADVVFVAQVFDRLAGTEGVAPFTLQYVDSITSGGQAEPANLAGSGSYVVVSTSGWLAYLGDASNSNPLANRLLELQQILSIARQQHLQLATIDLRFGLRPVYTLKS